MSRSALLFSLVFHAGMLAVLGWSALSRVPRPGPGASATGVSFSTEDAGGLVLVESIPASAPAVEVAVPNPETHFAPPVAVIDVHPSPAAPVEISPPVITITAVLPPGIPPSIKTKKDRQAQNRTSAASSMKRTPAGAATGATGNSLGGVGRANSGIGYAPPQFLLRYKPPYPEAARRQRLEGTVLLLVAVDAAGHVASARIQRSCGHTVLDRAALAAVKAWRFSPARQMHRAVAATVEVPIRFTFSR